MNSTDLTYSIRSGAQPTGAEIVFIEGNVPDLSLLQQDMGAGREVYVLDPAKDGLAQMASILEGRSDIAALHLVTHGTVGTLQLGATTLDADNLAQHQAELQTIGNSLSANGDILLYGCDVGAGAQGQQFIDKLAAATGADVAASNDLTGAASKGGDWNLEVRSGDVEAKPAVDAHLAAVYQDVLALSGVTVGFGTVANFNNVGSAYAGASSDVTYKVGGNAGYVLKIDGLNGTAYTYVDASTTPPTPSGYVTLSTYLNETLVTASFTGGNVFTLSSLDFTNFDGTNSQTEVFRGYDAGNTLVASTTKTTAAGATDTVNFTGFTNITKLKITTTTNSGVFRASSLDNLVFSTIAAVDTTPPTVSGVTSTTANGAYKAGDVIAIQVVFSETVNVTGTPQLTLETGATDRVVNYSSGTGTSTLTFNYTVQAGDTSADLDYLSTSALALNGGTIKDLAGNSATTLTLAAPGATNSLGANKSIVIDTTAPTSVGLSANSVLTANATSASTIATLSASDVHTVTYSLATGNGTNDADNSSFAISGTSLNVGASSLTAGSYHIYVAATDTAGNVTDQAFTVSVTDAPSVSSIVRAGGASATVDHTATSVQYTVTFDQSVTGVDLTDFTLVGSGTATGSLAAVTGSGTTYTVTVDSLGGDGTMRLDLNSSGTGIQSSGVDIAAGYTSGQTYTLDHTAPTIVFSGLAFSNDAGTSNSDFITKSAAQTISATLSGAPGAGDIVYGSLDNGTTWTDVTGKVSGTTLAWTGVTLTGSDTLMLKVTDAAGNDGAASSQAYVLDTTAPTVSSVSVPADGVYKAGNDLDFTVNFSEAVTVDTSGGTPRLALTIGASTVYADYLSGSGTGALVFRYAVQAGDSDSDGITVGALTNNGGTMMDTAGNFTTNTLNSVASTASVLVDTTAPTVTDAHISISGASGTGGAFKIGDTVTATWDNTAAGDNNSDVASATVDFSQFGGGSAVSASNSSGTWTATYTITAGSIDATNRNVSVTATDNVGNSATTADGTNATVDNIAPTVTDDNIGISGASGTGGAFKIGDTVTATWNNTAGGDNNSDTISGVTVDFSAFGGGSAVSASNSSGSWTATYTIIAGAIDGTNKNVSVTAADNAGNTKSTADTTNATVDNIAPTVTDGNIGISGASGTGGAFKIGDTVTATWNNTAGGDNNSDTISGVTVDFSAFGGGSAVSASNSSGSWTATYTIIAGAIDGTNKNVSVTATDNAGNTKSTADTTNATVDNIAPTVTDGNIGISGASGTGGTFKIGDTVTATWNNTAGGDNNSDTISGVTVDFSAFGGGSAVSASNSSGTWTATYTIVSGAIDGTTNNNVSVTAADNAGNTKTTADTTNATVDNVASAITFSALAFSADTGTSSGDFITKTAAQTISATLSGALGAGDIVYGSLDNGASWTDVTSKVSGTTLTWDGVTLAASDTLMLKVTDAAGNDGAATSQAYFLDTTAPTVSNVGTSTADGNYHAGDVIAITVAFGESVTVTGTPQLTLETGTTDHVASYASGSGTNTLTFNYTVQAGDTSTDLDYLSTSALALNGGTIADTAGNGAVLTLASPGAAGSLGANANIQIDVNQPLTGALLVSGTPTQGQVLSADTSGLSDADGLGTFSYTWMRDGNAISLATSSTYTLTQADVNAAMSVKVSYTDGFGHAESVTSGATSAVANVNDAPTGSVLITGTVSVGQTVAADASGLADLDGLGTFSYQWITNGNPIVGANSQTYLITSNDTAGPLTVQVSYVDGFGTSESVLSSPVTPSVVTTSGSGNGTLIGGAGNDVLDGGSGADTMIGGAGNDTYYVDDQFDKVIEDPGAGIDTVYSKISYVLPANVENLILFGSLSAAGTGNNLDNQITGNTKPNQLMGGLGADTLTGGAGGDTFVWRSAAESPAGVGTYDVVTDFSAAQNDKLDLHGMNFHFIGTNAFSSTDATGELRFDPATHMLYGSTNADANPEFAVLLVGVTTLFKSSLVL